MLTKFAHQVGELAPERLGRAYVFLNKVGVQVTAVK